MSTLNRCFPGNHSLILTWPWNEAKATIALTLTSMCVSFMLTRTLPFQEVLPVFVSLYMSGILQHVLDLRFVPRVMLGTSISLMCHV